MKPILKCRISLSANSEADADIFEANFKRAQAHIPDFRKVKFERNSLELTLDGESELIQLFLDVWNNHSRRHACTP